MWLVLLNGCEVTRVGDDSLHKEISSIQFFKVIVTAPEKFDGSEFTCMWGYSRCQWPSIDPESST